jgi:hypothetical protein
VLVTNSLPRVLTRSGPRIDERLVAAIARLDDRTLPIAETNRRLGVVAEGLGLIRPSYQQVRVIVHEVRSQYRSPRLGEMLLESSFRIKSPDDVLDFMLGS